MDKRTSLKMSLETAKFITNTYNEISRELRAKAHFPNCEKVGECPQTCKCRKLKNGNLRKTGKPLDFRTGVMWMIAGKVDRLKPWTEHYTHEDLDNVFKLRLGIQANTWGSEMHPMKYGRKFIDTLQALKWLCYRIEEIMKRKYIADNKLEVKHQLWLLKEIKSFRI